MRYDDANKLNDDALVERIAACGQQAPKDLTGVRIALAWLWWQYPTKNPQQGHGNRMNELIGQWGGHRVSKRDVQTAAAVLGIAGSYPNFAFRRGLTLPYDGTFWLEQIPGALEDEAQLFGLMQYATNLFSEHPHESELQDFGRYVKPTGWLLFRHLTEHYATSLLVAREAERRECSAFSHAIA